MKKITKPANLVEFNNKIVVFKRVITMAMLVNIK